MTRSILGYAAFACVLLFAATAPAQQSLESTANPQQMLTAVPFQKVHLRDAFWGPRIAANQSATIEANLHQCEITFRIRNFAVAGKLVAAKHEGFLYNDSDVYQVIEGIAYALSSETDPAKRQKLEERTDKIIDQIASAQQPDGYLNTYFTLVEPDKRWTNIRHGHELYCAGHLIEAAIAYRQATGKGQLLGVASRFADHIDGVFGPGQRLTATGHEELELALIKLYRLTDESRYLQLAKRFIDARGHADRQELFGEYAQDHVPVRQQREVVGHAVRAMYLYAAMADLAAETGDAELLAALDSIWHDVVDRKMYVTGGIGPSASNEGFTVPYDLPNDSAYAETCAAIGMALWNHRLFLMSGDGKYADVLERAVYNGLLSGVSLAGDRFFYVNPLGSKGNHHRVPWFDCSCCPTNIVRYIPGMGERAYAVRGRDVWTVLYMGGAADLDLEGGPLRLVQTTKYPWDGTVEIQVECERGRTFGLHLRIPGWVGQPHQIAINGQPAGDLPVERGYVTIERAWESGDRAQLTLPMPAERFRADPRVQADVGRVALMRGPIVYCLEGVDNVLPAEPGLAGEPQVRNLFLPPDAKLESAQPAGGYPWATLRGTAQAVRHDKEGQRITSPFGFTAIPYACWDNREPGPMVVWLPETPDLVELPGEEGEDVDGVRVSASHVNPSDSLAALMDGQSGEKSDDHGLPRFTWWDKKGSTEWVAYRFAAPREIRQAAVQWFDDAPRGGCRAPASWRLLWKDGDDWKPVALAGDSDYANGLHEKNSAAFEPVVAQELRLEVQLQDGFSGGILEWSVE